MEKNFVLIPKNTKGCLFLELARSTNTITRPVWSTFTRRHLWCQCCWRAPSLSLWYGPLAIRLESRSVSWSSRRWAQSVGGEKKNPTTRSRDHTVPNRDHESRVTRRRRTNKVAAAAHLLVVYLGNEHLKTNKNKQKKTSKKRMKWNKKTTKHRANSQDQQLWLHYFLSPTLSVSVMSLSLSLSLANRFVALATQIFFGHLPFSSYRSSCPFFFSYDQTKLDYYYYYNGTTTIRILQSVGFSSLLRDGDVVWVEPISNAGHNNNNKK